MWCCTISQRSLEIALLTDSPLGRRIKPVFQRRDSTESLRIEPRRDCLPKYGRTASYTIDAQAFVHLGALIRRRLPEPDGTFPATLIGLGVAIFASRRLKPLIFIHGLETVFRFQLLSQLQSWLPLSTIPFGAQFVSWCLLEISHGDVARPLFKPGLGIKEPKPGLKSLAKCFAARGILR
jgi:hypothetical protein